MELVYISKVKESEPSTRTLAIVDKKQTLILHSKTLGDTCSYTWDGASNSCRKYRNLLKKSILHDHYKLIDSVTWELPIACRKFLSQFGNSHMT